MAKKLPKKLGRPPIMGESKMLTIRVPVADLERWKAIAGDNLSGWIRDALNARAMRDEKKARA